MTLAPGTRMDAYELVRPLGSGGRGEVGLATEVHLGRKVALKLLPSDLTLDPTRVTRFQREARAASALNHPNVCVIHALGLTADAQHYIAMEFVDGRTLRARLAAGRMTVADALDIAVQIVSALTAAHVSNIVHRDIKPENVMLRPDQFVKVLDFGLAKLTSSAESDAAHPTETVFSTETGTVVGTVAYMSPEQARGEPIDARTDIWAVGAVLYEMVAGRSPFVASSTSEILAGILERDPPPLARIEPLTPPELQRLVTKALRKDREQRYQTCRDLLLDLQALRDEVRAQARPETVATSSRSTAPPQTGTSSGDVAHTRSRRRGVLVSAGSVFLVGLVLAAWWWKPAPPTQTSSAPATSAPVQRFLTRLTFAPGLQSDVTWSPDAQFIAYASDQSGNSDIWVQPIAGGEAVQLTRSAAADTQPAWSPDGRSIVFRSERDGGGLFIVPAFGGPERQLTSSGVLPQWAPDGSEILFRTAWSGITSLHAVAPGGGESPRDVLRPFLSGGSWSWIASHPDGRVSALGVHPRSGVGFFTLTRDGRRVTQSRFAEGLPLALGNAQRSGVGRRVERFQWNAAGTALYVEAIVNEVRNIWRVQVEPTTLEWRSAEQLTAGAGADVGASLSRDGTRLVFTTERHNSRLWVFPFDAAAGRLTGEGTPLTPEEGNVGVSDLAPDGSRVAYVFRRPGSGDADLWTLDIDSGKRELLAQSVVAPCWSPDGEAIAYSLFRPEQGEEPGEWALAVRALAGTERLLSPWSDESALLPSGWTRDGQSILGAYLAPVEGDAVLALWPSSNQSSKPERVLFAEAGVSLWQGRFSPDGRWISFVVQRRHAVAGLELMIAAAAGAPAVQWTRIAADHVSPDKPRWAPDGRTLYFLSRHQAEYYNLWGIRFDPERGSPVGAPFKMRRFDSPGHIIPANTVTAEIGISGRRALVTMATVTGNIWMLDNVDK